MHSFIFFEKPFYRLACVRLVASAISLLSCLCVFAADEANSNAAPKLEFSTSAKDLSSFRLEYGFRLELVAAEPAVESPVAIAFDENGRLFVVEMRDYPDRRELTPHLGRVRLLQNPDTNGTYRSSSVFAEDLPLPSAVVCFSGGVFVAATPDIFYLKDSKRDGIADVRQVVLTGFGGTNTVRVNALVNSFEWGLDNRIYGVTAGIGGTITASNWPAPAASVDGYDFSFDPRSLAVSPEAGPAQSGLSFDNQGRKFVSDFSRLVLLSMYAPRYMWRNGLFAKPPSLYDVAGPATTVFRFQSGPINTNFPAGQKGRTNALVPVWLTDARGSVVYRGGVFPTNYLENIFTASPGAHAVHRSILLENGLEPVAQRSANERGSEFLVSSDSAFRPVQLAVGPDGALYVVDMRDGHQQGRIYRIVPESFRRPPVPQLGRARTHDLVAALASNLAWYRETASRLLFEQRDPAAVPLLSNTLINSPTALARMRALHGLAGQGALKEPHILKSLRDQDFRVREQALLLSEQLVTNGVVSDTLWTQLRALSADPSIRVRRQLAFSLGQIGRPDKAVVLAEIASRDPANPWVLSAVYSSLSTAGDFFTVLANDARFTNSAAGQETLRALASMIGLRGRLDEVTQVIRWAAQPSVDRLTVFSVLYALGEGLGRTRSSFALVDPQGLLQPVFYQALQAAPDPTIVAPLRLAATRLLGVSPYTFAEIGDWLLLMSEPQPFLDLRAAAIQALVRYDEPAPFAGLLNRWPLFTPALRTEAITDLLSRARYVLPVLDALESGRIPTTNLTPTQLNFLRTYDDPGISQRAIKLFGPVPVRRAKTIDSFKPALALKGVAERGRNLFLGRCADCHRLGGVGQTLGPDLVVARIKGREKTLAAIIEPNAEVLPDYRACIAQTTTGENCVGIKTEDGLEGITLRQPQGRSTVLPRLNLRYVGTRDWSLMPVGIEQGLSKQDMADLLEYIMVAPR